MAHARWARRTAMEWIGDLGSQTIAPDRRASVSYPGGPPAAEVSTTNEHPGPQAFLVEMGGDTPVLGVHFHPIAQFQYFTRGTGRFGGHDVRPGIVHYSDPLTPYGPLEPGHRGVAFLTLRSQ